jgi:hypothetical protein
MKQSVDQQTVPWLRRVEPHKPQIVWYVLHLLLLMILINHQDSAPIFLGFSAPYAVLLGLIIAFGIAGGLLLADQNSLHLPQIVLGLRSNVIVRTVAMLIGVILIYAIWTTPFEGIALSSLQRETIRGWASLAILAIVYIGLFYQTRPITLPWALWFAAAALAGAAVVILAVHYIDRFPALNLIDELHNWSVQWTFANTGLLGEAMYRQMIPIPQPLYPGAHYLSGILLHFIGDGFWQARLARMLLTMLALPFIYLSGKRMYGARAGLFAVVFALLLIVPDAYVRPDFFVGIMLSIAIYVYLRAQKARRPWLHYLAGLCVALGMEGHALTYRFGVAFALLYGLRWIYEMKKNRCIFLDKRFVALVLGGATGLILYLSINILPGLDQGLHFASFYGPLGRTVESQVADASNLIQQQIEIWVSTSPFEFIFVILGLGLALFRFEDGDRLLLAMFFVSEGLLLVTYTYYRPYYQVQLLPVFSLLAGRLVANVFDTRVRNRLQAGGLDRLSMAFMVFAIAFLVLNASAVDAASDPLRDDYTQIGKSLKTDLPTDKIIVGNEAYFLQFRSMNYYGIQTVTTPGWFKVNFDGVGLWVVTNPDIFILSPEIDTPRYTDLSSINQYMLINSFNLVRCYSGDNGLVHAQVYARDSVGMKADGSCSKN